MTGFYNGESAVWKTSSHNKCVKKFWKGWRNNIHFAEDLKFIFEKIKHTKTVHAGIHPPGVSLKTPPPPVWAWRPPSWVWAWRPWKACLDTTCKVCLDTNPPGDLLQGMLGYHPPPRGQNSWPTLMKILPCSKLRLRAVKRSNLWISEN